MENQEPQYSMLQMPKNIKWNIPDTIRTEYVTHLIVQQQGSAFTLYFFEVSTPLFTGSPEEQIAAYKELEYLEAKCVAKFAMSLENTMAATNNLIESLNRFQATQAAALQQAMKGQENAGTPEHSEFSTST